MSLGRDNLEGMITGYDPETLRERIDRAAVESRLAELGNGRSTAALGEKAELLRLLGRNGEALVAAEHAFRLAHFSGDREQLTAARLRRARVFQYQGELDRALAEMTAVRASAALEEWASLEASAAYSSGSVLFDLGRYTESREAFAAALDIRTGSEAPAAEIEAARFALEAATRQAAAYG
jgi:tetratricopeptide (TPR) repeat protein